MGANIGVVAAARELIVLVFYGLRDWDLLSACCCETGADSPALMWWARIVVATTPSAARSPL